MVKYFSSIRPSTTMKTCPVVKQFGHSRIKILPKYYINHKKFAQDLKLCRSGKISHNMVTLTGTRERDPALSELIALPTEPQALPLNWNLSKALVCFSKRRSIPLQNVLFVVIHVFMHGGNTPQRGRRNATPSCFILLKLQMESHFVS